MKTRNLILLLLGLAVDAAPAGEPMTYWKGSSEIGFSGTSTLHDWSGKVPTEPFVAAVMMDGDNRPKSLKAKVEVKAVRMDTGEAKRDENMRKDMKVSSYPLIIGTMDTTFDKIMPGDKTPSKLPFTLTIIGTPQPVDARISNWRLKGDIATFDLDFELSLKRCGIKVPAVLFVISVGDIIKLHAPVKLVRTGNPAPRE